jgi:hypothetical protein
MDASILSAHSFYLLVPYVFAYTILWSVRDPWDYMQHVAISIVGLSGKSMQD